MKAFPAELFLSGEKLSAEAGIYTSIECMGFYVNRVRRKQVLTTNPDAIGM
ncbi:MAG: hypothetical protein WD513_01250 [Balneolaceae bacterium]